MANESTRKQRGRPTSLTQERREKILTAIRAGNTLMDSAAHADVGYSTLLRWMKNEHTFYKRFQLDVLEAKAAARVRVVSSLHSMSRRNTRAAIAWLRTSDPDTWGCATCPRRSAGGRDYEGRDARDPDLTRQAKPEGDDGPDIPVPVCVRIWRIEERDPGMVKPGWSRDDAWAAQNLVMKSYGRRYLKVILGRDLEPGDLEAKPLVVEFEMPDKIDIPRGTYDPDRRGDYRLWYPGFEAATHPVD